MIEARPRLRRAGALLLLVLALLAACQRGRDGSGEAARSDAAKSEDGGNRRGQGGAGKGECPPAAGAGTDPIRLVDATAASGLEKPLLGMFGHAAGLADVNGDGWLDLLAGTFADKADDRYRLRGAPGPAPDRLLLGGPGGFTTDTRFPEQYGRTSGAALADLDGDGDADLVLVRNGRSARRASRSLAGTTVFRNDGRGSFAVAATLAQDLTARAVSVLDYDGDGRLDLYVTKDPRATGRSTLLQNRGDFRFQDVTEVAGLPADAGSLAAVAADLNDDGRPDLFTGERLFVNLDGRFREADGQLFRWERYGDEDDVAGVAVGDLDGDGRPDLVVGQHFNSTLSQCNRVPVRVFLNRSDRGEDPTFTEVTEEAGIPSFPTKAPHVEIEDFDNDGLPDILATASAGAGARPAVLRQRPRAGAVPRFEGVDGLGDAQYWVTGMTGDVDRDGRLDVFVAEFDPAIPSRLFRNETAATGNWLEVVLPPGAVGSVVEVYRAGGAGDRDQLLSRQFVVTGDGNGGGAPFTVHVGLGAVTAADVRVVPTWSGPPVVREGVRAGERAVMASPRP